MKELFKNRTIGFYLGLAAAGISLITALIYLVYTLVVGLFVGWIFVFMLLGTASMVLVIFKDFEFAPLLPTLFYGLAFAFHVFDRVEMFAYTLTGVYGLGEKGGIIQIAILILALMLVSVVLSCISAFNNQKKENIG